MAKYNYGKPFDKNGRKVMYRYTNKDKSTKVVVDAKTKKVLSGRLYKLIRTSNYRKK